MKNNGVSQELEHAVLAFCLSYKDEFDRTWREIKNPSHTNGLFWQMITQAFEGKGLVRNEHDLKFAIKQVYARLERGELFRTLEEIVMFCEAHRDAFKLSFTFDCANLRRLDGELVATMYDSRANAIAVQLLREMADV